MKENKLLSICMPTYNRKEKALKQIKNIIAQIDLLEDLSDIEFFVSDNCSPDETTQYVFCEIEDIPPYMKIVRQELNLGLVGNSDFLFKNAVGEYVWFISDDDFVTEHSIELLLKEIHASHKSFYLLDFKQEVNGELEDIYWQETDDYASLYKDGSTGGFGLISAEVFKKTDFDQLFSSTNISDSNLMYPMSRTLYGLFCLNGKIIFNHAFVIHHAGDYSWISKFDEVQSIYSYQALLTLQELVPADKFKFLMKLHTQTNLFKVCSFRYLLKAKDLWYFNELRKKGMLLSVILYGAINTIKSVFVRLLKICIKK